MIHRASRPAFGILGKGVLVVALLACGWFAGRLGSRTPDGSTTSHPTVAQDRNAASAASTPAEETAMNLPNIVPAYSPKTEAGSVAKTQPASLPSIEKALAALANTPGLEEGALPPTAGLLVKLRELGPAGRKLLEDMLSTGDRRARIAAAQLLGQLGDAEAVTTLLDASLDEDFKISTAASRSLAMLDDARARDALRDLAQAAPNRGVEVNALYGLSTAGDPQGVRLALDFLEDPSAPADLQALLAGNLAQSQSAAVLPIVERATELFPDHTPLLNTAIEYYKSVDSKEARERLATLSRNSQIPAEVREAAEIAVNSN